VMAGGLHPVPASVQAFTNPRLAVCSIFLSDLREFPARSRRGGTPPMLFCNIHSRAERKDFWSNPTTSRSLQ